MAPKAKLPPISHFSTGNSGSDSTLANSRAVSASVGGNSGVSISLASCCRHAVEEQPRNRQANPDHEAEQAHHVNQGQPSQSLRPQAANVRGQTDAEKRQHEEEPAKDIGLVGAEFQFGTIDV